MNDATREIVKGKLEQYVDEVASFLERRALYPTTMATKASQCQGALKKIFPVLTTQQRWTNLALLFPERFAMQGNHIGLVDDDTCTPPPPPETVELTHAEASANLRLTYALCYANIQGRTLSEKHVCLLDTAHPRYFTTRHLIVGVSRATHGRYVHVASANQEKFIMQVAYGKASPHLCASLDDYDGFEDMADEVAQPAEDHFGHSNLAMSVAVGPASFVLRPVGSAASTEHVFSNAALAGCARLRCEPCGLTLCSDESACSDCKRSREEIIETQ